MSARTQYVISRIISHGARLDVLAEDVRGKIYHLEIENRDETDHPKRVRFYGAVEDAELLRKGSDYSILPDRYIFYISSSDIWKSGKTIYHEKKCFEETGLDYDDGAHVIYVNTEVDDGTRIAKLMQYFKTADPEDDSEGELSKRVRYLKREEGGTEIMCEIMERIRQEGRSEGRIESDKKTAVNLFRMGMPAEKIAQVVEENVSIVKKWLEGAAQAK